MKRSTVLNTDTIERPFKLNYKSALDLNTAKLSTTNISKECEIVEDKLEKEDDDNSSNSDNEDLDIETIKDELKNNEIIKISEQAKSNSLPIKTKRLSKHVIFKDEKIKSVFKDQKPNCINFPSTDAEYDNKKPIIIQSLEIDENLFDSEKNLYSVLKTIEKEHTNTVIKEKDSKNSFNSLKDEHKDQTDTSHTKNNINSNNSKTSLYSIKDSVKDEYCVSLEIKQKDSQNSLISLKDGSLNSEANELKSKEYPNDIGKSVKSEKANSNCLYQHLYSNANARRIKYLESRTENLSPDKAEKPNRLERLSLNTGEIYGMRSPTLPNKRFKLSYQDNELDQNLFKLSKQYTSSENIHLIEKPNIEPNKKDIGKSPISPIILNRNIPIVFKKQASLKLKKPSIKVQEDFNENYYSTSQSIYERDLTQVRHSSQIGQKNLIDKYGLSSLISPNNGNISKYTSKKDFNEPLKTEPGIANRIINKKIGNVKNSKISIIKKYSGKLISYAVINNDLQHTLPILQNKCLKNK